MALSVETESDQENNSDDDSEEYSDSLPDLVPVSYPMRDTGMSGDLRFVYRNYYQVDEESNDGSRSYDPLDINSDFYNDMSDYSSDEDNAYTIPRHNPYIDCRERFE